VTAFRRQATRELRTEYGKPRLRRIELMTEEVMGVACKTYDPERLGQSSRPYCGIASGCQTQGS